MVEFDYQLNVSSDLGSQFEGLNHTEGYKFGCDKRCLRYRKLREEMNAGMIRIVFLF